MPVVGYGNKKKIKELHQSQETKNVYFLNLLDMVIALMRTSKPEVSLDKTEMLLVNN